MLVRSHLNEQFEFMCLERLQAKILLNWKFSRRQQKHFSSELNKKKPAIKMMIFIRTYLFRLLLALLCYMKLKWEIVYCVFRVWEHTVVIRSLIDVRAILAVIKLISLFWLFNFVLNHFECAFTLNLIQV